MVDSVTSCPDACLTGVSAVYYLSLVWEALENRTNPVEHIK